MQPDFEAHIRFLSEAEGGRRTPAAVGGYRPQFKYVDDDGSDYDIWPLQCFTPEGEIEQGRPIPSECVAHFTIINSQLREDVHQKRIEPGLKFQMREGSRVVGEGEVTRILGLFEPR